LSDVYLHERSYDLSLKEATTALKLNPNNYRTRMIRASSSIGLRKWDDAERDYLKLIETTPGNPTAYYQMGLLKSALKDPEAAIGYFNTAYAKNNKLLDVFVQIVKSHVMKKEFKTAHDLCEKQIIIYADQKPLMAVVHNIEAGIYLAERNLEQARVSLNNAISIHPDYLAPYETQAKLFLAEKNTDKAIQQYQTIINKNPNLPLPHMMLGTIYDSTREFEKAADHYQKALDINPTFAPAANNLAYHLLKRTDRIDEALRLARIAKERLPEDPGVMDTLGMVYYEKGLYGNAVNEFLDSLKKIPDHPTVNYHLGMAYAKKENKELAIGALTKALKLSDTFEDANAAKQLLAELKK
jgi:tetratricopeptide (TPR) repeat protein